MRLAGVSSIKEANAFSEMFLLGYNERFALAAKKEGDLHRPLPEDVDLREIFCLKATRTINNGYIVKWRGRMFLIENPSIAMRRRKVTVMEHFDGKIAIKFNGRYLEFREVLNLKPVEAPKVKKLGDEPVKKKSKYIPPADHPWRRHNPSLHHNSYLERI